MYSRGFGLVCLVLSTQVFAMDAVRVETRTDEAVEAFGVTGKGVTVAVLDRGISWDHPDFINDDGTTRIRWMLDQSGQNLCNANNPEAVEYSRSMINAALKNDTPLAMRDAVGHGDATAGTAAGNGRALPDRRYRGIAPEADLIIVKMTSEGAPAHGNQPAEAPFQGCIDEAIEWASEKMDALGQPAVLIINSGVQWGPMDGSSAVSRKLAEVFPEDLPGRIVVIPSGDEGSLDNHSRAGFNSNNTRSIALSKASNQFAVMSAWFDGDVPAEITVEFDDGAKVGPVQPGQLVENDGITVINYNPGTEFYPWLSDSGDRAAWIGVEGHATTGSFKIRALEGGPGTVDLYGDVTGPDLTPVISMTSHLTPGRLNDYATTPTVIVAADHVVRGSYIDLDGINRDLRHEGDTGELWLKSSGGPTRDGRDYGVDISAPGQNLFATASPDSYWGSLRHALPQSGNGQYVRFGGTSGSAPITLGAAALMLQVNPLLSTRQARQIMRATARKDMFTGDVPNPDWGYGKLDIFAAVERALQYSISGPWYNALQSGHGWFVEVLQNANGSLAVSAYWYVYLDGKPAWLLGTGPLVGTRAVLDTIITRDGQFPPDFTGAEVENWGTMTLDFNADRTGNVSWQTDYPGFNHGDVAIEQLGVIAGRPSSCRSGSYFNLAQAGHGFVVQVISSGAAQNLLVAWYVYLNGEQVWLLGIAPLVENKAVVPLESFTGADFPPAFGTGDVISQPWGSLTMEFTGKNTAKASWDTTQAAYSDGEIDLIRLSVLGGHECME